MTRCVAMISGGLDSLLAARLMQLQGVDVQGLHIRSLFADTEQHAERAAQQLAIPLCVLLPDPSYLEILREPRFGFGRGAEPCLDCRIHFFRRAAQWMHEVRADFVVSGEVLGQRSFSQRRRDLEAIAYHAGLEELLLRPLSARCLPPTDPERAGWVDRSRLPGISGRGRRGLLQLANELEIADVPPSSSGCALADTVFARKVRDLLDVDPQAGTWEFQLLSVGRHFRHGQTLRVVIGRRDAENERLLAMHQQADAGSSALLVPANYLGASALIVGTPTDEAFDVAAGLMYRFGKADATADPEATVHVADGRWSIPIRPSRSADEVRNLSLR